MLFPKILKELNFFELNLSSTAFGERSVAFLNQDTKVIWVLSEEDGLTEVIIDIKISLIFQNIAFFREQTVLTFNYNDTGESGFIVLENFKEPKVTEME